MFFPFLRLLTFFGGRAILKFISHQLPGIQPEIIFKIPLLPLNLCCQVIYVTIDGRTTYIVPERKVGSRLPLKHRVFDEDRGKKPEEKYGFWELISGVLKHF